MSKIGQSISGFFARRAIKGNSTLSALHERSEKLISEILQNGIGEDVARGWAQQTFEQLWPVLTSRDPKIECRRLLVSWALLDCDYKVIMIPPSSEPDWTGLRGLQGISGELWEHRRILAQAYEPIRDTMHAASGDRNSATVEDVMLVLATQAGYLVNMANTARVTIDDYHHDLDKDWFRPMMYSFSVSSENKLRKLIGLPTSLDEDIAALSHRAMIEVVLSGARFPDVTWREGFRDQIGRGALSLPSFRAGAWGR